MAQHGYGTRYKDRGNSNSPEKTQTPAKRTKKNESNNPMNKDQDESKVKNNSYNNSLNTSTGSESMDSSPEPNNKKITDVKPLNTSVDPQPVKRSANKDKPNNNITERHNNNWTEKVPTLLYVFLVAAVIVACIRPFMYHTEKGTKEPRPLFEQFKDDNLKTLRTNFPSQNKVFWRVVVAPIRRIFKEEDPEYPAVLLFAIPKGPSASLTGSCLAHHLTHHLNVFHGLDDKAFINIEKDLKHDSAAEDKKELDDKLIHYYSTKASKGVVVDHFEKLSPMATLLFHGYCDGDNAPYKNVSMVLVLHTDIDKENIWKNNMAVDNFLQNLWIKELDEDKIPPLISRIANNVAIVTPEDEQSMKKLCPWL